MQSCGGEACQGSSSNLDDHEVSNISPGSTILMLVYGVENNWRNGNHHHNSTRSIQQHSLDGWTSIFSWALGHALSVVACAEQARGARTA